ncbi:Lysine--tRNA ligase, mitochondrial [Cyberlindnera fabianii]|uniref:Lysine--tRNA ligase, mitochondrial n=1 Tax=Cyberlindnera fabianii TaxID=36022 RepID=A0A1V2LAL4_CYBFA|nr:Lysine--tRNA ligase, mitochondrial [Cyberlindnera fabianii]
MSSVWLISRSIRLRTFQIPIRLSKTHRYHSSLAIENEENEFAKRQLVISENNQWFYPQLTTLREGLTPTRLSSFRSKFESYNWPEAKRIDDVHLIEGRISSIRKSGKGMIFLDLTQDMTRVQVVLMNKMIGESKDQFSEYHDQFKKGDHVIAIGYPGVTNTQDGFPIMHPIPPKLTSSSKRFSNRVVDYLVNTRSRDVIVARSKIINDIRKFLDNREFVEVSTPTIASNTKGANATPFTTYSKHIKKGDAPLELQLRVAPELWLKKLVIGGFDKVYEVSQVFRNEGIDSTHNPEFTTVEFYQSFTTLEELMKMTEDMFKQICETMMKYDVTKLHADKLLTSFQTHGFKKLEFIPEIQKATGHHLPTELTVESLTEYFSIINLPLPPTKSVPHLLDKLSSTYLEPQCTSVPTFIYHQPSAMSPLAKSTTMTYNDNMTYDISRRFELFINGSEYVNAYEEENSPLDQTRKFKLQQQIRDNFHDDDSIVPDYKYLAAMEWGLPPTGGWGLGVDRLCMLLVGEKRIEEVLTFGTLPDVVR